jgi:hypothetical protein
LCFIFEGQKMLSVLGNLAYRRLVIVAAQTIGKLSKVNG